MHVNVKLTSCLRFEVELKLLASNTRLGIADRQRYKMHKACIMHQNRLQSEAQYYAKDTRTAAGMAG